MSSEDELIFVVGLNCGIRQAMKTRLKLIQFYWISMTQFYFQYLMVSVVHILNKQRSLNKHVRFESSADLFEFVLEFF